MVIANMANRKSFTRVGMGAGLASGVWSEGGGGSSSVWEGEIEVCWGGAHRRYVMGADQMQSWPVSEAAAGCTSAAAQELYCLA